MKAEMTKSLRKTAEKYGSVLAAFRSQGGAGKGLAAGGIAVAAIGLLIGVPLLYVNFAGGVFVLMILAIPGIAMAIPGGSGNDEPGRGKDREQNQPVRHKAGDGIHHHSSLLSVCMDDVRVLSAQTGRHRGGVLFQ